MVKTSFGDISYIDINSNKQEVILFCTGGGVGLDSVNAFKWLKTSDFRVICINRPGYNKLNIANDFETHADIFYEVLIGLNINTELINVFGVSMGGASAISYTRKYGAKKLLLWSAITTSYLPNEEAVNSALGKLVMNSQMKDIISYFLMYAAKLMPSTTFVEFVYQSADISKEDLKKYANTMMKNKDLKAEFLAFVKSMTPMSYIYPGMMKEIEMAKEFNGHLSEIKTPCYAIHSILDKDVPIAHLDYLAKLLPYAKTVRVKCLGHYVWWGPESEEVINNSLSFLKHGND